MSDLLRDRLDAFGKDLFDSADLDAPPPGSVDALLGTLGLGAGVATTVATTKAASIPVAKVAVTTAATASKAALVAKLVVVGVVASGLMAIGMAARHSSPVNTPAPPVVQPAPPVPVLTTHAMNELASPVRDEAVTPSDLPAAPIAPTPLERPRSLPKRVTTHAAPAAAPAASAAPPALGDQVALVDAARAALREGDAANALATTRRFAQQFGSDAALYPEAMLVALQAHLARGDEDAARKVEEELRAGHPSSPAARRAGELLQSFRGR